MATGQHIEFVRRNVALKMELKGYNKKQINIGCDAAIKAYQNGAAHSNGKLFDSCLNIAFAAVGKPKK
ncbi:hypothetical protein HOP38_02555 [Vibrio mediterranei]|uniref:hypothetical protein n=1 Tax=Vibrio mediterranei TaxID=689 RepID=UPI001807FECB|nr:hypothetical protein [Vibrio mediterranei]NUW71393.1 hypothetical protein [Vibrio mediterranei]